MIRRIGRYELLEEVGTGGMSVVYRGRDSSLDREVAVKVLHPHLASKPESRARFSREARAVARLSHPGIVEIFDYSGDDAAESWIVTEFVHGRTLRDFADQERVELAECGALVGLALADALAHAHAAGVIHRDLKPENVMISEAGSRRAVKLADFGIARILWHDDRMTMTGALVGSPNHMAPEIVDGAEADVRSDVFSLGTILYWLCTGSLPFAAPNPTATLRRLLAGDYVDPRTVNPALGEAIARLIRSCLSVDPAGRPQSAAEVRDQIAAALREDGIDQPAEALERFLASPREEAASLRPRLVEARLRRGEAHLAAGEIAGALGAFDGVLALDPDNASVHRHLAEITRSEGRRRVLRRLAVVGGLVAVAVAGAVLFARMGRDPMALGGSPSPSAPSTDPLVSVLSAAGVTPVAGLPSPGAESGVASPSPVATPTTTVRPQPGTQQATPRVAPATVRYTVHVRPYASRAFLDGVEVASDTNRVVLDLMPGSHRLRFEHPCCEPFDREVDSVEAARTGELKVPLVPRPASLRVSGSPATKVFVDGKLLGTAGDSQRDPFRIPIPSDGPNPYEGEVDLLLQSPGRSPSTAPVRLRAGQEVVIPAVVSEDARR